MLSYNNYYHPEKHLTRTTRLRTQHPLLWSPPHNLLSKSNASLLHPSVFFPNAASSASRTVRTNTNSISFLISSATSCSTSLRFAHGRISFVIWARCAPRTCKVTGCQQYCYCMYGWREEKETTHLLLDASNRSDPTAQRDLYKSKPQQGLHKTKKFNIPRRS